MIRVDCRGLGKSRSAIAAKSPTIVFDLSEIVSNFRRATMIQLNNGIQMDTKGVWPPIKYSKDDHRGLIGLRDYAKYIK